MINRRTVNTTGLLALATGIASAAGAKTPAAPSGGPAAVRLPAAGGIHAGDLHATPLADAQLALASKLIGTLARGTIGVRKGKDAKAAAGPKNIVVSPIGVAAALALVGLAAEPAAQRSFQSALQFRATPKPESDLEAVLDPMGDLSGGADMPLTIANRLVLDPAMKPERKLIDDFHKYKVEIGEQSLTDSRTVGEINDWVKKQTHGLVPSIVDELPHNGSLVALNALYFKDRWLHPFDKSRTKQVPFHPLGASTTQVQMMQGKGRFRFRGKGRFLAVDLSFATARFALTVVTTTDKPAAPAELLKGAGSWLDGRDFAEADGIVALPRLEIATATDLLEPMIKLGLPRSLSLARLSRAAQRIASISQKATLKLDEQGAEAAAATAVVTNRSLENKITEMSVDKPFLFALRDKKTGFVLLAGYMNKPETVAA